MVPHEIRVQGPNSFFIPISSTAQDTAPWYYASKLSPTTGNASCNQQARRWINRLPNAPETNSPVLCGCQAGTQQFGLVVLHVGLEGAHDLVAHRVNVTLEFVSLVSRLPQNPVLDGGASRRKRDKTDG